MELSLSYRHMLALPVINVPTVLHRAFTLALKRKLQAMQALDAHISRDTLPAGGGARLVHAARDVRDEEDHPAQGTFAGHIIGERA